MNALRRLTGLVRDSPTYGRDRANLMSGVTIGTAGLLLNAAVLVMVLPLLLDPDDRDFREITQNVEFGQLLALILLGGASGFATLLIPLRMVTVFWGPRGGRYFDQIVLSGISPLRFVIGKALSQNLFLGLILFLLLPYFALSLTLGGVDPKQFAAGLFLVWLYCMALALVTLWVSLYLNEGLAAGLVIGGAACISALGIAPLPFQPAVVTPFPALIHPVWTSISFFSGRITPNFGGVFFACAGGMTALICAALLAIHLGPLFGIVRENSTFGEVVREGDNKRKRWFRLRRHIQRPSEIAFFYENRGDGLKRCEGLVRWGIGLGGLLLIAAVCYGSFLYLITKFLPGAGRGSRWWVYEFHMTYLIFHGVSLALAVLVFSHALNSTYLKVPFVRGRLAEVSRMDTASFLLFALISTTAAIGVPFAFEDLVAVPNRLTVFPALMFVNQGQSMNYLRLAVEAPLVLLVSGLVVYALQRFICLTTWLKSTAFVATAMIYSWICGLPIGIVELIRSVRQLREIGWLADISPTFASISPATALSILFNEARWLRLSKDELLVPFYVFHAVLLVLLLAGIRRRGRTVRKLYLTDPEANG